MNAKRLASEWPKAASRSLAGTRLFAPLREPRQMCDCPTFELHLRNAIARSEERTGIKRPFPEI